MKFPLASYAKRAGKKRDITFAPIIPTKAQAADLYAVYRRILAPLLESRDRIVEVYTREIDRVLQTDSIDDLSNLMDELGQQVQRLVLTLTPDLRNWAFRTESWHRDKWARTVLSGTGIDIRTLIGPQDAQETVEAFLARNLALVKDISAQAQGRIADAVFRGFQQRTPAREVGKEIAEALGMARRRARNVAADQGVKIASALDAERQRQAGLDHWKWRSSHKLNFRPEHQARDGKIYTDKTAPQDLPGQLPFCACTRQGLLVIEGEVL